MPPSLKSACPKQYKLNNNDNFMSDITMTTKVIPIVTFMLYQYFSLWKGRSCNIHRTCKDFNKDVLPLLGSWFFCWAYQMKIDSFQYPHILRPTLEKQFSPTEWGSRDFHKSPYLIQTDMRLLMNITFLQVVTHMTKYLSMGLVTYLFLFLFGVLWMSSIIALT